MDAHTEMLLCEFLSYDQNTGAITAKQNFWRHKTGSRVGSKKKFGYRSICFCREVIPEHHLAWFLFYGEWPKEHIDHINGIRDDNRITNLREVTRAENARNRRRMRNNTSGVQGVYFFKRDGVWKASIKVGNKSVHLGYFDSKEEAALVRLGAERALGYHENHGKNFA